MRSKDLIYYIFEATNECNRVALTVVVSRKENYFRFSITERLVNFYLGVYQNIPARDVLYRPVSLWPASNRWTVACPMWTFPFSGNQRSEAAYSVLTGQGSIAFRDAEFGSLAKKNMLKPWGERNMRYKRGVIQT